MVRRRRNRRPDEQRLLALKELAERLGLLQADDQLLSLLHRALTTKAWVDRFGGRSNEVLEWLGDAVWNLAVTELVVVTQAHERRVYVLDGLRRRLVSGELQARLAQELHLDELLLVPEDYQMTERSGKFESVRVLHGNAMEAVVGAIAEINVREAVETVKRLVRPTLIELARGMQRLARDARVETTLASARELYGHARLQVYVTREVLRRGHGLTLHGLHRAREQTLTPRHLSQAARMLGITARRSDQETAGALLVLASEGRKLSEAFKAAMRNWAQNSIQSIEGERGYLRTEGNRTSSNTQPSAESDLRVLLNGHAVTDLSFDSFPYGGGEQRGVRIVCKVNGVILGEARHKDVKTAREEAARLALNHPRLQEVRRGHYK